MSERDPAAIIAELIAAIDGAIAYSAVAKSDFLVDPMRQDAVVRKIEVVGEAAKALRDLAVNDAKLAAAMAPHAADWKGAAGMRDQLIHKYWAVDLEIVWSTVKADLPRLRIAAASLTRP